MINNITNMFFLRISTRFIGQLIDVDLLDLLDLMNGQSTRNKITLIKTESSLFECGRWDLNPRTPKGQDPQFIRS